MGWGQKSASRKNNGEAPAGRLAPRKQQLGRVGSVSAEQRGAEQRKTPSGETGLHLGAPLRREALEAPQGDGSAVRGSG